MSNRLALLLRSTRTIALACACGARDWAVQTWRDPVRRDRAQAAATFAFIAAFTLASIDYLICGGMEWSPGGGEAYAMELAQPPAQRASAPLLAALAPPPPAPPEAALHERDYSVSSEELLGGPLAPTTDDLASVEPLAVEWSEAAPSPAAFAAKTALPY